MESIIQDIIEGLQSGKARHIQVIDMRDIEEAAFQYFVICEGTSSTHVYGLANGLTDEMLKRHWPRPQGTVGMQNRLWVAMDYGHVLVHIFQPETREFYRLDSLWQDAHITDIPDEL